MRIHVLERAQRVHRPLDEVFAFFADAANLDLLTPPWLRFRILTPTPIAMAPGTLIDYSIRWRGLPLRWRTRIEEWFPGRRFVDMQIRGPYRLWHHTHTFERAGNETIVQDVVRYALPLGPVGHLAHALLVARDVQRIFDFRERRIRSLFAPPGVQAQLPHSGQPNIRPA